MHTNVSEMATLIVTRSSRQELDEHNDTVLAMPQEDWDLFSEEVETWAEVFMRHGSWWAQTVSEWLRAVGDARLDEG